MSYFRFHLTNEFRENCADCIRGFRESVCDFERCTKLHPMGLCVDVTVAYTVKRDCMCPSSNIDCFKQPANLPILTGKYIANQVSGWTILREAMFEPDYSDDFTWRVQQNRDYSEWEFDVNEFSKTEWLPYSPEEKWLLQVYQNKAYVVQRKTELWFRLLQKILPRIGPDILRHCILQMLMRSTVQSYCWLRGRSDLLGWYEPSNGHDDLLEYQRLHSQLELETEQHKLLFSKTSSLREMCEKYYQKLLAQQRITHPQKCMEEETKTESDKTIH